MVITQVVSHIVAIEGWAAVRVQLKLTIADFRGALKIPKLALECKQLWSPTKEEKDFLYNYKTVQ